MTAAPELRACRTCGESKPLASGYYKTGHRYLLQCKSCHTRQGMERRLTRVGAEGVRAAQREYNARRSKAQKTSYYLRHRYGIGVEEFHALEESQDHACAICQTKLKDLDDERRIGRRVDHDHVTGRIRGLLCDGCNKGLGHFRDQPDLLREAARYLDQGGVPMAQANPTWIARTFTKRKS